jgi:hypothetical protein
MDRIDGCEKAIWHQFGVGDDPGLRAKTRDQSSAIVDPRPFRLDRDRDTGWRTGTASNQDIAEY